MKNIEKINFAFIGAVFAFLSVALGAFAAHGLKNILDNYGLQIFDTAVKYQMFHSLPILFLGHNNKLQKAKLSFSIGILLFSGSLYILAITGIKAFGAITPLGGLFFLLGWLMVMFDSYKQKSI